MAKLITLPLFADARGELVPVEWDKIAPFEAKRVFFIRQVPPGVRRGGHAHRDTFQLLICAEGSLKVSCDNGKKKELFELSATSNKALLMPPSVWSEQYDFAPNTVLIVLASSEYDPDEYIRDYDEFKDYSKNLL